MNYYAINSKHTFIISPIDEIKPLVCGCSYVRDVESYIIETILKFSTYLRENSYTSCTLEERGRVYIGDGITVAIVDLPLLEELECDKLFKYVANVFDLNYYYEVNIELVNKCISEVYGV